MKLLAKKITLIFIVLELLTQINKAYAGKTNFVHIQWQIFAERNQSCGVTLNGYQMNFKRRILECEVIS